MKFNIKVKVMEANWLPVMNDVTHLADAYAEVRFKNETFKTEVAWNTLNPKWETRNFIFEADERDIFEEILQLKIVDHDNFSTDNTIGKFNLNLIPLLNPETGGVFSGWVTIFDSVSGIRGKVNIFVELEMINHIYLSGSLMKERNSIVTYSSGGVPDGYYIEKIHGLVSDHTFDDDPEHKWIDLIRSQRTSNDVRQRVLSKLSNHLQYKIVKKSQSYSGNAIIGYTKFLNIEKEFGLYMRGIGTCVTIRKKNDSNQKKPPKLYFKKITDADSTKVSFSTQEISNRHNSESNGNGSKFSNLTYNSIDLCGHSLESISILTINHFPISYYSYIGGMVAAYSIQNLSKYDGEYNYGDVKDQWWNELRYELKTHAHFLECDLIIAYTESEQFIDDMVILSVFGTAVSLDNVPSYHRESPSTGEIRKTPCSLLHIRCDYSCKYKNICQYCGKYPATNNLFSTMCLPEAMPVIKKCGLINVCSIKSLKYEKHEELAESISQAIPFLEHQLMTKFSTKMISMDCNAAFKIETKLLVNANLIYGIRTGNIYKIGPFTNCEQTGSTIKRKDDIILCDDDVFENFPSSSLGNYTELHHIQKENLNNTLNKSFSSDKHSLIDIINYLNDTNQYQILPITFSTYAFGAQIPSDKSLAMTFFDEFPKISSLSKQDSECHSNILSKIFMNEEDYLHAIVTETIHTPNSTNTESTIFNQPNRYASVKNRRTSTDQDTNNNIVMTNRDHLPFSDEIKFVNLGYINHCLIKESLDIKDEGGVENFMTIFIKEAIEIFKNYAIGMGGDAIISFRVDEFRVQNYLKRNQAESLICISGNAIKFENNS